jgi:hypothetical protein
LLDFDKMITFDSARLEYTASPVMIFLDIDEYIILNLPRKKKILSAKLWFNEAMHVMFHPPNGFTLENILIPRFVIGGRTRSGEIKLDPDSPEMGIRLVEDCVQAGVLPSLYHTIQHHTIQYDTIQYNKIC